MTTFTVTLDSERQLAGLDAALAVYNADKPEIDGSPGRAGENGAAEAESANPGRIADRQGYLQFVLSRAAESWANQHGVPAAG